jgi:ribonuclease HII
MNLLGIDEAGRGPVIGPLVIAGVVLSKNDIDNLVEIGLTDSKLLTRKKRKTLFDVISTNAIEQKIEIIKASEIDLKQKNGINLNRLETETIISILKSIKQYSKAYVDACDVNAKRFQRILEENCNYPVIAEHSADLTYPVVSAASIMAKVTRDKIIDQYHIDFGVDFGSGYPSDTKTIRFLEEYYAKHKSFPNIVRMCWETTNRIIEKQQQDNLDNYFENK